ncbi:hypothetical protein Enr10x_11060 [Gimesia panareensis]|uniref:Uncharacterized protein n=1 Tax=Gimesia panareensis TaxID=2527978 RepID=A0A517Q2F1_9PLAN|nr:hypothetical protein [Gimesia panareensis]QDT25808.1 hypothetical protein Enr10x_11060 [Gimesia panareensis]
MSSPSSNENLSAYFDREASAEESHEVESLLEQSAAARQELHEFGELSRLLQETATESAPPELAPSIRKRIEQETLLTSPKTETAPVPPGPSMLRYRIAVAISACSSLAALVLFILLLNIPENPSGTNWQFSSVDRQSSVMRNAEPAAESTLALKEGTEFDSYHSDLSYQGKPFSDVKLKTAAASPAASPSVSFQMTPPAAKQSGKLNEKQFGLKADGLSQGVGDFAISNSFAEKKVMEQIGDVEARSRIALPAVPQMTGLPAHIPVDSIRIGDVLPYFQDINGKVAVIEVRVVDVKQALGRMELLLTRNNIPVNKQKQSEVERQLNRVKSRKYKTADQKQPAAAEEDDLFAVFVEASDTQVASALNDLQRDLNQSQLLGLSLQPAIDESSLTKSVKDLPQLLAENNSGAESSLALSTATDHAPASTAPHSPQNDGLESKSESGNKVAKAKKQHSYQTQYRMQLPPEQLARRAQQPSRATPLPALNLNKVSSPDAPLVAPKPTWGMPRTLADRKLKTDQRTAVEARPPVRVLFVFKHPKSSALPPAPPAAP